jgi:catechol 2,3-dioxygenase-like lactoylglutathione lyase family enzyme
VENPPVPQYAQVVFDTTNPRASAEFWRELLGLIYREGHAPPPPGEDDPAGRDWLNLFTADGSRWLAFQKVDELPRSTWPNSKIPQQLHVDLMASDIEELMAIRDRVLELGGEIRYDRSSSTDEPLYVFSDLDGHPFCVFVEL